MTGLFAVKRRVVTLVQDARHAAYFLALAIAGSLR